MSNNLILYSWQFINDVKTQIVSQNLHLNIHTHIYFVYVCINIYIISSLFGFLKFFSHFIRSEKWKSKKFSVWQFISN